MSVRIAILDDDRPHVEFLLMALKAPLSKGLGSTICVAFDRGEHLRRTLRRETFDLVILDWNLPDYDGLRLLRWLRERDALMPVLMLSARALDDDVAGALLTGADDYITKPFRPLELRARVLRLLERARSSTEEQEILRFGNWSLDRTRLVVGYTPRSNEVPGFVQTPQQSSMTEETKLTDREFRLTLALFRNLGAIVSRGYLGDVGGISGHADSRTLDSHVYKLRRKLQLGGSRDLHLHTVYGRGYRLDKVEPAIKKDERPAQARDP